MTDVHLQQEQDAVSLAATFAALVDVLLPGDHDFPAASTTEIQAVVLDRLRSLIGWEGVEEITSFLNREQRFIEMAPKDRIAHVLALETERPDLFTHLRFTTYLAYYETPVVIRAIRQLGHDYNDAPLPQGYTMAPFDPRPGFDLPRQPKGTYLKTEEIERIDLSPLADLDLPQAVN